MKILSGSVRIYFPYVFLIPGDTWHNVLITLGDITEYWLSILFSIIKGIFEEIRNLYKNCLDQICTIKNMDNILKLVKI